MFDDVTGHRIDTIAANGDVEVVLGAELARAVNLRCDQVQRTAVVALAAAQHLQRAARLQGIEQLQLLVLDLCSTDREAGPGGVDEAAAVEGDAVGVGEDVVGRATEDFLRAFDQRGVAADHLIEDGRSGLTVKLRVGRQGAGQLRLARLQRVVEHQPGLADVIVDELVVRQATGIWRDDFDHRHAMGRVDHGRSTGAAAGLQCGLGKGCARAEQADKHRPAQCVWLDQGELRKVFHYCFSRGGG